MTFNKNNLTELKRYFRINLPTFSSREIDLILKELSFKRLEINSTEFLLSDEVFLSDLDFQFYKDVLKRLQKNEPFQYIIGEVLFYNVILKSDNRALIPRPETEELVDWVLKSVNNYNCELILDLCSGSGCIAFAIKKHLSNAKVFAMEKSSQSVGLIFENIEFSNINIDVLESDIFNPNSFSFFNENSFDLWIANPPYIPISEKEKMKANVLDFEPHSALFVNHNNPIIFYQEIALNARRYLKDKAYLFFEIHEGFNDDIICLLSSLGFVNIDLRKDMQGRCRMIRAQNVIL